MMQRPTTFMGMDLPPVGHIANVEEMAGTLARKAFTDAATVEHYGTPENKRHPVYAYQEGVIPSRDFQITVTVSIHRPIVTTEHVTRDYAPYEEDEG